MIDGKTKPGQKQRFYSVSKARETMLVGTDNVGVAEGPPPPSGTFLAMNWPSPTACQARDPLNPAKKALLGPIPTPLFPPPHARKHNSPPREGLREASHRHGSRKEAKEGGGRGLEKKMTEFRPPPPPPRLNSTRLDRPPPSSSRA